MPSRGHCESAASILLRSLLSEAVEAPLSQALVSNVKMSVSTQACPYDLRACQYANITADNTERANTTYERVNTKI